MTLNGQIMSLIHHGPTSTAHETLRFTSLIWAQSSEVIIKIEVSRLVSRLTLYTVLENRDYWDQEAWLWKAQHLSSSLTSAGAALILTIQMRCVYLIAMD